MPSHTHSMFGGQKLILDARGALYHAGMQCLIVSDLHLEKASFLAQRKLPVPQYDTQDTLVRLQQLIRDYQPQRVVCLGDSFHDARSQERLAPEDQARLVALVGCVAEWQWILGNHDFTMPQTLPGTYTDKADLAGIQLLHEPADTSAPQIVGHFHPKCSYKLGGHTVRGKSFIHDEKLLIMPAFGSYTGGLSIKHAAIHSLLVNPQLYLCYREGIWKVPYQDAF